MNFLLIVAAISTPRSIPLFIKFHNHTSCIPFLSLHQSCPLNQSRCFIHVPFQRFFFFLELVDLEPELLLEDEPFLAEDALDFEEELTDLEEELF